MKISFDFRIFLYQKFGGISRYYVSLFSAFKKDKNILSRVICLFHLNKYLQEGNQMILHNVYLSKLKSSNFIVFNLVKLVNLIWERVNLTFFPPDVYHLTYYDKIPYHSGKTKIVVSVYDMIHELYPDQFLSKASLIKKKCTQYADLVICISENTKRDLVNIFKIDEKKIKVIYLGFREFDKSNIDHSIFPSILFKNYILFVGQRSGYKNFESLARAYAISSDLYQNFHLVCFGGGQFSEEEMVLIKDLKLVDKVFQIEGDDQLLKICYEKASIFVYPSLYEGFGIPPLEAMSCGTPVCCSNTSSLPEVVGSAAELFDPNSVDEIFHAIHKVLYSGSLRNELIIRGKERIKFFTWEKCAKETYAAYKSIL